MSSSLHILMALLQSIFAVAAIVAIISFVRDTIDPNPEEGEKGDLDTTVRRFEIGKLLCMVVIGLHFGVIIVGGRAWALCFRLVADCDTHSGKQLSDIEAMGSEPIDSDFDSHWDHIARYRKIPFYRYVAYCERAQLIGTLLLFVAMLLMQFSLFSENVLPWVFLGAAIILVFSIYLTGFWDVSVTRANITGIFTRSIFTRRGVAAGSLRRG